MQRRHLPSALKSSAAWVIQKYYTQDPSDQSNYKRDDTLCPEGKPHGEMSTLSKRNLGSPAGEAGPSKMAGVPPWRGGLLYSLLGFEA